MALFNDPESVNLTSQIKNVLVSAGWVEVGWKGGGDIAFTRPGHPILGFTLVQGLFVQADNSHASVLGNAVVALASALTAEVYLPNRK